MSNHLRLLRCWSTRLVRPRAQAVGIGWGRPPPSGPMIAAKNEAFAIAGGVALLYAPLGFLAGKFYAHKMAA